MAIVDAPENPRAVIGDNKPPLREVLAEANAMTLGQVEVLLVEAEEVDAVLSDAEDAKVATLGTRIQSMWKTVEARRVDAKRPHDELAATAHGFFKPYLERLDAAKARIATKSAKWKETKAAAARESERRRAAEARLEAQRLAAAAAAEAAAGQHVAADTIRQISGMDQRAADHEAAAVTATAGRATRAVDVTTGAQSSARQVLDFAIEDFSLIPLEELRTHFKPDDYKAAVARFVRAAPAGTIPVLAGVRIFQTTAVTFKR